MPWDPPSARIRELIRKGAEAVLNLPPEWLAELDEATLAAANMRSIATDPVLAAGTRRTNRSNLLFWAAANVRDPGVRVPPNIGHDPVAAARDLVRRGLNESALDAYRVGQGVALRLWMRIAFTLTSDPVELEELLDVSCRSISTFVDDTVAAIAAQMSAEREELTRGSHAERRDVVTMLLDGAPIGRQRAESRLGYRLDHTHTAAVVWADDPEADMAELDRIAEAIAAAAGEHHPLTIVASAATRWVWVHGQPELGRVEAAVRATPAVRVALGCAAPGLSGFRRSHLDALTTQRMLSRLASTQRVAAYDEVELVALITQDQERADEFIARTLGDLADAAPELTSAVHAFVAEEGNATRAAARLFTHRNTLLRRLGRANRLLPRPLAHNTIHVGVALEVLRWRGSADHVPARAPY
jgi:DNA-binding PucR family transcriptional regulator